ncbi:MAG: permease-like cell division protein FtsX [Candidatus Cloacimonetes bacterium]|nr:permease-like cell division protein FtsX [Candidatus Cloacimonadota bacterium]
MKLSTLSFFFSEALLGFRKAGIMAWATISTVAISLTILGGFLLFYSNLNTLLYSLQNQLQINFYLNDHATDHQLEELVLKIKQDTNIESHQFIDKTEALAQMRKDLKNDGNLLDNLSSNPLPNTITIQLKSNADMATFRKSFDSLDIIQESSTGKDWVDHLLKIINMTKAIGSWIVILLGLANLSIIVNTIRLTVFARKDQIEIMRLVGATNWFIRMPFLIEGMLQGLIGALCAILCLYCGYEYLISQISTIVPDLFIVMKTAAFIPLTIKLLFLGIALGLFGSLLSLRRFLV